MANKSISLKFDEELLERFDKISKSKGMTRTALVHYVLSEYVEDYEIKLSLKEK